MEPYRFDRLARSLRPSASRRGALGIFLGSALGLVARDETAANRQKHARLPKCAKLKARCSPKKNKKGSPCCDKIHALHCDQVGATGFHCCYDAQQICSGASGECCRDLTCGTVPALSGSRCCARTGAACTRHDDCCDGAFCIGGVLGVGVCGDPSPPPCVANGQPCPGDCDLAGSCAGCCGGYCNSDGNCDLNF